MTHERTSENSGAPHSSDQESKGVRRFLLPSRAALHPWPRLAFGALLNIVLAMWAVPQIGHVTDPEYSSSNALQAAVMVAAPCASLLTTLPVLLFGRDVPRLISIGLSFLPCYLAIVGLCDTFSLWTRGR
jgi:hypothetical protein